jgi:hypothetical protein
MGYATQTTGNVGTVSERRYAQSLGAEMLPGTTVNGKVTSWVTYVYTGETVETTKRWVGLSKSDADAVVSANPAYVKMVGSIQNPVEKASRTVDIERDGDTDLWNVTVTDKSTTVYSNGIAVL